MATVQMFLSSNEFSFAGLCRNAVGVVQQSPTILHFFDEAESGVTRLPREDAPL
jgi:hypothetical protein